jgi:hypothetical protein
MGEHGLIRANWMPDPANNSTGPVRNGSVSNFSTVERDWALSRDCGHSGSAQP